MKFKRIVASFLGLISLCVLLSLAQALTVIDPDTGFFFADSERRQSGIEITVIMAAILIAMTVIACFVRRAPRNMPKLNWRIVSAGVFYAVTLLSASAVQLALGSNNGTVGVISGMLGVLSAITLAAYSLSSVPNVPFHKAMFAVPVLYYLVRLIYIYMIVTTMAFNTQNLFWALCESSQLLFMLQIGKIANGISKNDHKKTLALGFVTTTLAAMYFAPGLIAYIPYYVESGRSVVTVACSSAAAIGAFMFDASFLFSHFSVYNLRTRSKSSSKRYYVSSESESDDGFYLGGGR